MTLCVLCFTGDANVTIINCVCMCVRGAVGLPTSLFTTDKTLTTTTTTTTTTATSNTTTTAAFYRETWFTVVVCVAVVVVLILFTLVIIKCCCRRQAPLVRQRIPLDQSVKTSPPSYRYHDYRYHDNHQPVPLDKLRVRTSIVYVPVLRRHVAFNSGKN